MAVSFALGEGYLRAKPVAAMQSPDWFNDCQAQQGTTKLLPEAGRMLAAS